MPSGFQAPAVVLRETGRFDRRLMQAGLRRDAPIYIAILVFGVAAWPMIGAHPAEWLETLARDLGSFLVVSLVMAVALRFFAYVTHLHPASPIRQLVAEEREAVRAGFLERWMPLALASVFFMACFARFKAGIPEITGGFRWDATRTALGRKLHFGVQPRVVAHAILVLVGSVHLGWHYAVDAYLAFAIVAVIWLAATLFSRRWDARFAPAAN